MTNKKIAIFLSGRIRQYEGFLHLLKKNNDKYDIDVFVSINDVYSEFYENFKKRLNDNLKGFHCDEYNVPEHFVNVWYKQIEGIHNARHNAMNGSEKETAAYRTLSAIYNDKYCFNMATAFADENNFEYDVYLRFRSDIFVEDFPNFDFDMINDNILFSVIPFNKFQLTITQNIHGERINDTHYCYGDMKHHGKNVTADIAYGNRKTMSTYCSCYDYVLQKNIENRGNYYIHFEYVITTFLEDSGIDWRYFDYHYVYANNRHEYQK